MKSVFSKAKNVISCLESFMSVTVEMTFPLWLNFSKSIEWRWNFRSILTFWQWIIKVRSHWHKRLFKIQMKMSECSSMKWTACLLDTNVRGPVESFNLSSPDQPVVSVCHFHNRAELLGRLGCFSQEHKWRRNQTGSLCVCVRSPVTGESHISVSVKIKKKKIKANFV